MKLKNNEIQLPKEIALALILAMDTLNWKIILKLTKTTMFKLIYEEKKLMTFWRIQVYFDIIQRHLREKCSEENKQWLSLQFSSVCELID